MKTLTKDKFIAIYKFADYIADKGKLMEKLIDILQSEEYISIEDESELPMITPEQIIKTVAHCFEIPAEDIYSFSRKKPGVTARQVCMFMICSKFPNLQLGKVGELFGKKYHHTTVIFATKSTRALIDSQDAFAYPIIIDIADKLQIKL